MASNTSNIDRPALTTLKGEGLPFSDIKGHKKTIFLLRHGDIAKEYDGTYIGSSDISLSAYGIEAIKRLADKHRELLASTDLVLCSPAARCMESLTHLKLPQQLPVQIWDHLKEIDYGLCEGLSFLEICERYPELIPQWRRLDDTFAFPEGEGLKHFYARIEQLACKLALLQKERILLISHGGVIRHLILHLIAIPYSHQLAIKIDRGSLSQVVMEGPLGVLTQLNDKPDIKD